MNERRKIEDRLRKKEQEAAALEERLKETRIYIQALQDVLKLLPRDPNSPQSPDSTLRQGSSVAQARAIIIRRGAPVHISELLEELGKEPNRENRTSLAGSLAAYVRRGEIFTRPAPNTFGLVELGHANAEPNNVQPDEPPAGFGQDPLEFDDEIPF